MADDGGGLQGLLRKLQRKTAEVVAEQQAAFARGRVSGATVADDAGAVIVNAGDRIDDTAIERAIAAGRLSALAAAAIAAQAQDLKEKAGEVLAATPEGQESRALDTAVEYARARRVVGRIAGIDVTDIRGGVLVRAGRAITEHDVRRAREAGQLDALVYAAGQPYVSPSGAPAGPEPAPSPAPERDVPPEPRQRLPVVRPPDEP